jgi:ElaB/YqjD/DUF883 family membrane-anchored ribosome-binding protein
MRAIQDMARGIVPRHDGGVPGDDANPLTGKDRPILPWTLVAGAFVHFVVPIYLVALIVDTLLAMPSGATTEAMLRHALPFSGEFLVVYLAIALAVSLGAAAVDPLLRARRRRRTRNDPLAATLLSEQRLRRAVTQGRGLFGEQADTILQALQAAGWDHGDDRYRSLSDDLAEVVRTSAGALTAAPSEEIATTATRALEHLQDALRNLNHDHGTRRIAEAQAAARYVELRHGPSDFSSGGD